MTTPTVFVPARCAWINANGRQHWAVRAKLTKVWRTSAWAASRDLRGRTIALPVDITAAIHKATGPRRKWDPANLSPTVKACIDGMVTDGRVLPGDDTEHLRAVTILDGGPRDQPGITITITPV